MYSDSWVACHRSTAVVLLLLLLQLVLRAVGPTPNVGDSLISSTLGQLISMETVCATDWQVCPNGGRAFRDRKQGCAFMPCDRVQPFRDPATPNVPYVHTQNASRWFGNEEFTVPVFHARDMSLGRVVYQRLVTMVQVKARRCADIHKYDMEQLPINGKKPQAVRCADVYLLDLDSGACAGGGLTSSGFETYVNQLQTAVSPASTKRRVVFQDTWTRLALFGRLMTGVVSASQIEAMLQIVHEDTWSNNTDSYTSQRDWLPSLVIGSNGSFVPSRNAPDVNWTASGLDSVMRHRLLQFLEKQAQLSAANLPNAPPSSSQLDHGDNIELVVFITQMPHQFRSERNASEWKFILTTYAEGDGMNASDTSDRAGHNQSCNDGSAIDPGCGQGYCRLVQLQDEAGSTPMDGSATGATA